MKVDKIRPFVVISRRKTTLGTSVRIRFDRGLVKLYIRDQFPSKLGAKLPYKEGEKMIWRGSVEEYLTLSKNFNLGYDKVREILIQELKRLKSEKV